MGGVLLCIGLFFELARLRVGPWVALGASVLLLLSMFFAYLLAPAVDAWQKLRWLCVPIDIPTAYVPAACGR